MHFLQKRDIHTDIHTDGQTNGWTDQRTDIPSYRDAWTHLKTQKNPCIFATAFHCWGGMVEI